MLINKTFKSKLFECDSEVKNKSFFGMVQAFDFILKDWAVLKCAAQAVLEETGGLPDSWFWDPGLPTVAQ